MSYVYIYIYLLYFLYINYFILLIYFVYNCFAFRIKTTKVFNEYIYTLYK